MSPNFNGGRIICRSFARRLGHPEGAAAPESDGFYCHAGYVQAHRTPPGLPSAPQPPYSKPLGVAYPSAAWIGRWCDSVVRRLCQLTGVLSFGDLDARPLVNATVNRRPGPAMLRRRLDLNLGLDSGILVTGGSRGSGAGLEEKSKEAGFPA